MIEVYVKHKQKPDKCRECPFLDMDDECILQTAEVNFDVEDFEELHSNCPLLTFETEAEFFVEWKKLKEVAEK